jgi:SAM-dependent methyltransferase
MMAMKTEYAFEEWLSEVERVEYSDYWNDESQDINKIWWVLDGNFSKMEEHLKTIHAVSQLNSCIEAARKHFHREFHGIGADLAAGTLWATPHLLASGAEKVYSIEYSRHRLLTVGPAVLEHYQVSPLSAVLVLGDFNRLNLADATLDFIFMSQAFHHSEKPRELLGEIKRVLKPDGIVILTGEHIAEPGLIEYVRQPVRFLLAHWLPSAIQERLFGHRLQANGFWPGAGEVYSVDHVLGDHHYTNVQYKRLFTGAGFQYQCLRDRSWHSQAFVLIPSY